MNPTLRRLLRFTLLAALAGLSGCATWGPNPEARRVNLLGVVEVAPGSYRRTSPTTISTSTRELTGEGIATGTEVKLLWGLIQLRDY